MYRNLGLGSWIARRALIHPTNVALVHRGRSVTYQALAERITRLARSLDELGIGRGDRIAFVGHNHPAALETLFASGLLGATFVPVHPGFDDQALARVLQAARPSLVVATPSSKDRVEIDAPVKSTAVGGGYEELVARGSDEPMDRSIGLDDVAVLAFSSGTTGPNKAIRLTHGNLFWNALNTLLSVDYREGDVILTSAPLYRMGGLGFTLTMLLRGGTAVIQEQADPERSLRLIVEHRVSVLFDAVHSLEALRKAPEFASADLSSLRTAATGGSVVPPDLVRAFAERGVSLQPGYGLTEASPLALVVGRDEIATHPGAAGRPPMFTAVRVVGPDLEDVGPGEVGEILLHGPNVMAREHADPARFVEDGWLQTGDAAVMARDGMVTAIGRVSETLVVGGRRVHPGPVEARLRDEGLVEDGVLVQEGPGTPVHLFAVVRADPQKIEAVSAEAIGAPLIVHAVPVLPKNPNGKVVRAALVPSPGTPVG